jgi:hypothetical protein
MICAVQFPPAHAQNCFDKHRNRLELEVWVEGQLRGLYQIGEDVDVPQEIDLDEILNLDAPARSDFVKVFLISCFLRCCAHTNMLCGRSQNLVAGAPNQADVRAVFDLFLILPAHSTNCRGVHRCPSLSRLC